MSKGDALPRLNTLKEPSRPVFEAVIHCGGEATRFKGENKLLAPVHGEPAFAWNKKTFQLAGISKFYATLGGRHEKPMARYLQDEHPDVQIIYTRPDEDHIDAARWASFTNHFTRVNETLKEKSLQPFKEFPEPTGSQSYEIEITLRVQEVLTDQPLLLHASGDSIYPRPVVELTRRSFVPDHLVGLAVKARQWARDQLINQYREDIARKDLIKIQQGEAAVQEPSEGPTDLQILNEELEYIGWPIRPWGRRPFFHMTNSNKKEREQTPVLQVIEPYSGSKLQAEFGYCSGIAKPIKTRKKIALSVWDPRPFDFNVFGTSAENIESTFPWPKRFLEKVIASERALPPIAKMSGSDLESALRSAGINPSDYSHAKYKKYLDHHGFYINSNLEYFDVNWPQDLREINAWGGNEFRAFLRGDGFENDISRFAALLEDFQPRYV